MSKYQTPISLFVVVLLLLSLDYLSSENILASKQEFDRQNLYQFFEGEDFDNDIVLDTYLIPVSGTDSSLINLHLLDLKRPRLAYRARQGGEVIGVAVPASAEDGFNGEIELLVSVDMFGRIGAARVIEDIDTDELYGVLDVIDSRWMTEFSGNSMRDIQRISWSTITADNEYDQFVGASITPKAVSDRIYDALVFFQSNRIELMSGESN